MVECFFDSCVKSLSRRSHVFVAMSAVYFGSIFVAALLGQFLYGPLLYGGETVEVHGFILGLSWPLMILGIFAFNLVLSGFVFVTLPGVVFFPLSVVLLVVRAVLWGFLLFPLPTSQFLGVLPTLVLEGEGYVIASVAGMVLGLSWIKPDWVFRGETLSRVEALKKAWRECKRLYVMVVLFLLVAAVVETFTIILS